ncbi:MAG: YdcF family protein, partial [Actinomycetota bacterium]
MTERRRHPILLTIAVLVFTGIVAVGASAAVVWRAAHVDGASRIEHVDAIVVLGAAEYNGTPSPVFQGRLDHALLLYHQGRAGIVIVLGSNQPGDQTTEGQAGRDYLVSKGVPTDAALALPVGRSSFQSMQAVATYLHDNAMSTAFLVSDPWHNARIERMAADLGFKGYGSATWTSAAKSFGTRFQGYARETFAYLYYR